MKIVAKTYDRQYAVPVHVLVCICSVCTRLASKRPAVAHPKFLATLCWAVRDGGYNFQTAAGRSSRARTYTA